MSIFSRVIDNSAPEPEKLPLFARRGIVNGKRQNYLLRYECECGCGGLSRTPGGKHKSGDESRQKPGKR